MKTKEWSFGRWKVMLFAVVFAVALLSTATFRVEAASKSKGLDVSFYNKTVNWNKVKKQGYTFAMIRTGYGTTIVDSQFKKNYKNAGKAGIKRGVYHFAVAKTTAQAKKEAKYCLKILNGRKLEYPVAYDIEYNSILSTGKKNVTAIAKTFCDTIKKAGYVPMIYSSSNYIKEKFNLKKLKGVRLWVAAWNKKKPNVNADIDIWQYTATGSVPGANEANGHCDLNYSYIDARKIELDTAETTLKLNEKFTIKATVTPSDTLDKVTYTSSDLKVAKVSAKGVVTAKGEGTATITVKAGKAKAKCKVVVVGEENPDEEDTGTES